MAEVPARRLRIANEKISRILLATDFSRPARRAYTYALKFAQTLTADLDILHVLKAPPGLDRTSSRSSRSRLDHQRSVAMSELGRMLRIAEEAGIKAHYRLVVGLPPDSILEVAQESQAGMIVMGTHGRTTWDRLQFGSTSEFVVRRAQCPVLTVHAAIVGDLPMTLRRVKLARIVVATDFSPDAHTALRYAAVLGTYLQARILLVHAHDEPAKAPALFQARSQHDSDELRRALSRLKNLGLVAEGVCTPGRVADVILKEAESFLADLIVMGTRRTTALRRFALGSVADAVIRRAGCPVFVAKHSR